MEETRCPFCGEKVYLGLDRCPYCAEHLPDNLQPINGNAAATPSWNKAQNQAQNENQTQNQNQAGNNAQGGYLWRQAAAEKQHQNQYQDQSQYQGQGQYQAPGEQPYGYPQGYQVRPYAQTMSCGQSLRTCLIDKYATFSGRARRSEFWWFFLAQVIINTILSSVSGAAADYSHLTSISWNNPAWWLSIVVWLALLVPNLAVAARRLHDTGRSGWFQIIPYATMMLASLTTILKVGSFTVNALILAAGLAGSIVLLVWFCSDSTPNPNKWGPSPKYN